MQIDTVLKNAHLGEYLNFWFNHNAGFSKTDLARFLGYKQRSAVYKLIESKTWKLDILIGVCEYLGLSVREFLKMDEIGSYSKNSLNNEAGASKKLYLEDQVSANTEEIEKIKRYLKGLSK